MSTGLQSIYLDVMYILMKNSHHIESKFDYLMTMI